MIDFGITPQRFQAECFEKKLHRHSGAFTERPVSWSDLDALLEQIEPAEPYFRLYRNGPVASDAYSEEIVDLGLRRRRLNKERFATVMRGGATLVLNRMELFCAAARPLCAAVAQFTNQPTTGNGYISFGGTGTFGQHWDVHDVFVLQLLGRKRWRVFAPTFPLPLSAQTSDRSQQRCPAIAALDHVLESGDLLYIPRGWWHQVTPLDVPSCHLSVGSFAPSLLDYVMWVCSRCLPLEQPVRKSLVAGAQGLQDLAAAARTVHAALLNPGRAGEFLALYANSHRHAQEPVGPGVLSGLARSGAANAPER